MLSVLPRDAYGHSMDAFAWGVAGSVAGVVCAGAAIVSGIVRLWQGRVRALASALSAIGRYAEARDLARDTLNRSRTTLGDNPPDTLESADSLAADLHALGDAQAARDLAKDTLDRSRRILGDNHPSTMRFASNLTSYLEE